MLLAHRLVLTPLKLVTLLALRPVMPIAALKTQALKINRELALSPHLLYCQAVTVLLIILLPVKPATLALPILLAAIPILQVNPIYRSSWTSKYANWHNNASTPNAPQSTTGATSTGNQNQQGVGSATATPVVAGGQRPLVIRPTGLVHPVHLLARRPVPMPDRLSHSRSDTYWCQYT